MNDAVRHAKSYPFAIPDHSYLFEAGGFTRLGENEIDRDRRTPVLAAGSNQSPEQIARKYAAFRGGPESRIPAQRGILQGFDVVYAAHLARYGSVPATFQASSGTGVVVFVLWLDRPQLQRMHQTEANYTFDRLADIAITFDDGSALDAAYSYSSKVGCLAFKDGCASLAEIPAFGRRFPALTQVEVLASVRDRLAPGRSRDEFIEEHINDPAVRRARSEALRENARPLAFPREVITVL